MRHLPHMQSLPFLPREPNTVPLRTSILGLKVLEQYVFMIIAIVYSQGEFWVNVPIPMFFLRRIGLYRGQLLIQERLPDHQLLIANSIANKTEGDSLSKYML